MGEVLLVGGVTFYSYSPLVYKKEYGDMSTTPSELMNMPVPSIKSVVMATLRPELKAIANIYEDEINDMRSDLNLQRSMLLQLQGYLANQSNQILDFMMKMLEVSRKTIELKIQKVDRYEYNTLVDTVSTLGQTMSSFNVLLTSMSETLDGLDRDSVESILELLTGIQTQISTILSSNSLRDERIDEVYQTLLAEILDIRSKLE